MLWYDIDDILCEERNLLAWRKKQAVNELKGHFVLPTWHHYLLYDMFDLIG